MQRLQQAGFTLIEIMVVVVIIGILAALVVVNLAGQDEKARRTAAEADIRAIASALELYKLDNFVYPSTQQGLQALVQRPVGEPAAPNWKAGGYLQGGAVPKDPWGRPYQYLNPGRAGPYDVFSFGADGRPGGEGDAADIGNFTRP
jgi:general secretion pathway protein G